MIVRPASGRVGHFSEGIEVLLTEDEAYKLRDAIGNFTGSKYRKFCRELYDRLAGVLNP